jgi:hypothetical protein
MKRIKALLHKYITRCGFSGEGWCEEAVIARMCQHDAEQRADRLQEGNLNLLSRMEWLERQVNDYHRVMAAVTVPAREDAIKGDKAMNVFNTIQNDLRELISLVIGVERITSMVARGDGVLSSEAVTDLGRMQRLAYELRGKYGL